MTNEAYEQIKLFNWVAYASAVLLKYIKLKADSEDEKL